ncbi:hypothetical protein [Lysobacter sp. Root494]|uniref:hypothetical protein n=1 Tax=Lysobacter sp. Root494 TaxID=1736549 RepID=UPI000AD39ED9|nr:hypothetical protein [Lysobacter sp. Root494]
MKFRLTQSLSRMKLLAVGGALIAAFTLLVAAKSPERPAQFGIIDAQRSWLRHPAKRKLSFSTPT